MSIYISKQTIYPPSLLIVDEKHVCSPPIPTLFFNHPPHQNRESLRA
jgi:hypothetical protein